MKTEDLIHALSADNRTGGMSLDRAWALAGGMAVALAAAVFLAMLGPRADFMSAAETWRFLFKFVVTIVLATSAWMAIRAASRPNGAPKAMLALLATAPALILGAVLLELLSVPAAEWRSRMMGSNYLLCMTSIPLIGLAPLVIFVAALRYCAPAHPGLAGAVAGILAGSVAATFYAAHCVDDSPLFVAAWYTLAITPLALAGAIGGRFFARW